MAVFSSQSPWITYASNAGVPDVVAGEGTSEIQAILDRFGGEPGTLILDSPAGYLIDTIYIWGRTTLEVLNGVVITKKPSVLGTLNSGLPMLTNKHWVAGSTLPTDTNITIRGGYWDGNRRGGGAGNPPGTGPLVNGTYPWSTLNPTVNPAAHLVPQFLFCGVSELLIEDVDTYDSPAYTFHLSNVRASVTQRCTKGVVPGDIVPGNDLWHLNGYCSACCLFDSSGSCNDDFWAINADDGDDLPPGTQPFSFLPGTVISGPIVGTRVLRNRITGGLYNGGRLLSGHSAHYTDDTIIQDLWAAFPVNTAGSGPAQLPRNGVFFDSFGTGTTGTHKNVRLRDLAFGCSTGQVVVGQATVVDLEVSDVRDLGTTNTGGMVVLNGSTPSVGWLRVQGCSTTATAYLVSQSSGTATMTIGANSQVGATSDVHTTGGSSTIHRVSIS